MKKLLISLLFVGAMALTACAGDTMKASDAEKKLKNKDYSVSVYAGEEVADRIQGFDYENKNVQEAVLATKGENADADLFLAFYFKTGNEANAFMKNENNSNLAALNRIGQGSIGSNLEMTLGIYNNVCYVASQTAFSIVF